MSIRFAAPVLFFVSLGVSTYAQPPSFDVVSVKPSAGHKPGTVAGTLLGGPGSEDPGGFMQPSFHCYT
jgi:hypothetical protein